MDMVCGQFKVERSDTTVSVILGFVPDLLKLNGVGVTATGRCDNYTWARCLHDAGVSGTYGFINAGNSDTDVSNIYGAAVEYTHGQLDDDSSMGISVIDDQIGRVILPHPTTGADTKTPVVNYLANSAIQPTERTLTAIGTVTRPTRQDGRVYECTASAAAAAAEPTWSTVYGQETVDGGGNSWMCRVEKQAVGGGQGFLVGASFFGSSTDEVWTFEAYNIDRDNYLGDASDGVLSLI